MCGTVAESAYAADLKSADLKSCGFKSHQSHLIMYNHSKTWTTKVQHDEEEMFIPLPDELINKLGWKEGDSLHFKMEDGSMILTNQSIQKSE